MASTPRLLAAALLGSALLASTVSAKNYRIAVAAADVDRAGHVAEFKLPADAPKTAVLQAASGQAPALQIDASGTARFVIPRQKAGESLSFRLVEGKPVAKGVDVVREGGRLRLEVGGTPALYYQMAKEPLPRADIDPKYKRNGYLHPVITPSGTVVSDDYPRQHIHHHGIWAPWTKTKFQGREPDFWNMGAQTGLVEFVALEQTWNGPVHGGFLAKQRFVDLKGPDGPVTALNETWEVTLYNGTPSARVFDLVITQEAATNDPLILPEFHYGGLGFRGRGEWLGEANAQFLTSEGETDRVKAHATKARWVHMSGAVENGTAGLAILGHPENFRAPQPMRVHPKEPFVNYAPSQGGEWQIEPGKPYVARYRFVVADGAPDRAQLDAFWNGYAQPAVVTVASE